MIEVSGLTRYYGEFAALSDVSFRVAEGEVIGLLGLNGAGKSTTLKVLAGLIPPSAGRVVVDGVDMVEGADEARSRIGYLPEEPPLYREMTVVAFLRHMAHLRGLAGSRVEARLQEVIKLTQLQGREHQVIASLSHGYRKRVGIAQAVIHDPRLVILDEPISGLDPVQIVQMRQVIRSLGKGRVVLVSSHILSEISQTCDRLLVLKDGRLVAEGTEHELAASVGHSRLLLTVRGEVEAFEAWLSKHPKVKSFERSTVAKPFACAFVDLDGDLREAFLPEVAAAGFGLRLVSEPATDLEQIFLGLAKEPST